MKKIITSYLLLTSAYAGIAQTSSPAGARNLVSKMTLEEKVHLLVGKGMKIPGLSASNGPAVGQTKDKVDGAAGTTYAVQRLHIPSVVLADGPAGLRIEPKRENAPGQTFYCT